MLFFHFLVLKIEQNLKLLSHWFSPTPHHRFSIQQIDHHSQGTSRVGGLLHGNKTTGLSSWRSSFGRLYEADSQQPVWQNVSCQYQEIYSISSLCKKMLFFQDRVHSEALQYLHRHQRGRLSQSISITLFARLPVFGRWFNSRATLQGTGHHVATQHNRDNHLGVVKVPYVRLLL